MLQGFIFDPAFTNLLATDAEQAQKIGMWTG